MTAPWKCKRVVLRKWTYQRVEKGENRQILMREYNVGSFTLKNAMLLMFKAVLPAMQKQEMCVLTTKIM